MNNKILFADLDHTLLCDDKSISEKNRAAIQKMLERGHYFVLATGRGRVRENCCERSWADQSGMLYDRL